MARRVDHPERPCPTCHIEFKPRKVTQRFCGIECNDSRSAQATHRWQMKNKHAASNARHLRVQRLYGNPESVGVSERDWKRLVARYRGCCAYCGERPDEVTMDHVVPAARGGRHSIGNVLPACGSCNGSKWALFLIEFRVRREQPGQRPRRPAAILTHRRLRWLAGPFTQLALDLDLAA
jgi:5-methylcytosine-specific restriction endonuclease McrA